MTLQSVIDVNVNDAAFARFKQLFDRYQEQLAKTPGVWSKIGAQHKELTSSFEQMTQELTKQNRLARDTDEDGKTRLANTRTSETLWASMSRSSASFAKNVASATRGLLQWSGILTGVGGLLGVGGLWGIDRMAAGVAGQRRTAQGLGLSIGERRAFDLNLGRVVDADSFLGWVGQMETDISKQGAAYALTGRGLTGQTGQDALRMLDAVRGLAKRTPLDQLGPILGAYGLQLSPEEQRRIKGMSDQEYGQLRAGYERDRGTLGVNDKTAKAWQDFSTQMSRAGTQIENVFVRGLVRLAGPLEHLSSSFVKFVETLSKSPLIKDALDHVAHWLESFSGTIAKPEFLKKIEQFTGEFGALADVVHSVLHPIDTAERNAGGVASWIGKMFPGPLGDAAKLWSWAIGGYQQSHFSGYLSSLTGQFKLPAGMLEKQFMLESGGNLYPPNSRAGAIGAFQLMPGTAAQYGADPTNPLQSALAAAQYDRELLRRYRGDQDKALAAYNLGPQALDAILAKHRGADWRNYLPRETQNYLRQAASMNVGAPGVRIEITNATGGSAVVSASQLAH